VPLGASVATAAVAAGAALATAGAAVPPSGGSLAAVTSVDAAASGASLTASLTAVLGTDRPLVQPLEDRVLLERGRSVSRSAARRTPERTRTRRTEQRPAPTRTEKPAKERTAEPAPTPVPAQWALPVAGGYRLTASFGQCSGLWSSCHTGLDFAAPTGTPLRAVAGGVITEVGYAGAYGIRTILELPDGTEVWYCHQTAAAVGAGSQVVPGQVIGSVGSTGNVTGPHLHLEVRPGGGDPVDPYAALSAHGATP